MYLFTRLALNRGRKTEKCGPKQAFGSMPSIGFAILFASFTALVGCEANTSDELYGMPVYFGVVPDNDETPTVKFVVSNPTIPGTFSPWEGFSISPEDGECNSTALTDFSLPAEYIEAGPIDILDGEKGGTLGEIVSFLGVLTAAELVRKGYVSTSDATLPYTTCVREAWGTYFYYLINSAANAARNQ